MISTLVSYRIIPTIRRHGSHVTADEVIRRRRRLRLRLDHIRLRIWNASTWSDRGHRCQAATARSAGADDGAAGVRQGSDTCRTTAERATPTAVAWVVVALQRLHCGPHTRITHRVLRFSSSRPSQIVHSVTVLLRQPLYRNN